MSEAPEKPPTRRQRRSTLGKKERRNLVWFLAASGIAALLILAAALLRQDAPRIMPPETDDELAMRASPENAFYVLRDAVALLPNMPSHRIVADEENLGYVGPFRPEDGSIGQLLNLGRADTDPILVEYLEGAGAALEKMREALAKPYLRLPTPEHWKYVDIGTKLQALANLAVANAVYDVRYRGASPDPEPLVDVLELGELVSHDGGFYAYPIAADIQHRAMKYAWDAALGTAQPETQNATLDRLAQHALFAHSLQPQLEYDWRMLDRQDAFWILNQDPAGSDRAMRDPGNIVERMFIGRMLHRMRLKMIERRGLYLEAAAVDDFVDWESNHRLLFQNAPYFDPIYRMGIAHQAQTRLRAWLDGWRIVSRLESFQTENGAYPETLEAAQIDVVDPFSGGPYIYRKHPGEFTLYGVGANRADNGGEAWQEQDIVLRRASVEPRSNIGLFNELGGRLGRRAR